MSEELTWLPVWKMRDMIGKGEVSPVEVTEHFLGRIEEYDGKLKSFAYLDAKGAREQAKKAEKAVSGGEELGLLHGIPVSLKGHFYTKGMPFFDMGTAENLPSAWRDEVQVERFRSSGAIIFGQNTLMSSGGNVQGKPDGGPRFNWDVEARSAWDQSRVPGWSSSGTATATVARLVPLGLGSDGGGSTRLPAAYSGVVGVVATPGVIPWIHPASPAIELTASTGPMSRYVRDVALATQALAGHDGRDVFARWADPDDFLATIDDGVDGMRFAWSGDLGYASMYALEESPRVIAAIKEAAFGFKTLGATVEETDAKFDDFMPGFGMMSRVFGSGGRVIAGEKPTDREYWESMELRGRNIDVLKSVFRDNDVLLTPTSQLTARKVEDWDAAWTGTDGVAYPHGGFAGNYVSHVMLFNWLAVPAFSIPCGFVDGLPIGLQIVGKPGSDAKMFRIAQAFQKAFPRDERPEL